MVDATSLGRWIQPHHLAPDRLEEYRTAFSSHPAQLVVIRDLLVEGVAERLNRFLREEAQFEQEYGLYSIDGAVAREAFESADDADRLFRLSRIGGIAPEHMMSPNALTYLQFRQSLQQPACREFFEGITGLQLGSSDDFGVHSMAAGDFLRAHSDDVRERSIALVIYLTPGWQPEFGGALQMIDETGGTTRVDAAYNSMVVFDVQAENTHFVDRIEDAAGDVRRLTIGGWYPKPASA
jgi:2OG-Fe(II) oxygenase superfamily